MNRTYKLQSRMMKLIAGLEQSGMERDISLNWERIHLVSCANNGFHLAHSRGLDAELAAIACSLHDYGRVVTGRQLNHAGAGYEPLKLFLDETGHLSAAEIETVAQAVKNHSNKGEVGTPLEELVKDADVLDCYQYGIPLVKSEYASRLAAVLAELGIEKGIG